MPPTFYTTGDVCKLLRVATWQLMQAFKRGYLKEPARVACRRVWTDAELPAVRQALVEAGYLPAEEAAHAS